MGYDEKEIITLPTPAMSIVERMAGGGRNAVDECGYVCERNSEIVLNEHLNLFLLIKNFTGVQISLVKLKLSAGQAAPKRPDLSEYGQILNSKQKDLNLS
jgi:hypothetical protein